MVVTFYKCSDDPRKLNKSLASQSTQDDVRVYDGCSIINPVLVMRYDPVFLQSQYIYIDDWDRYYAITDVTVDNGKRMYVTAQLDALYTYRDQILACPANAIRNEGVGRPTYVPDDSLPLYPSSDYYTSLSLGYLGTPVSTSTPDPRYYLLATK